MPVEQVPQQLFERLSLPSNLRTGDFDAALDRFYQDKPNVAAVELDLSRCTFIEATCLLQIIAYLRHVRESNQHVRLRIPESKDARDFLRVWGFPEALRAAVGLSLYALTDPNDHGYFGENKDRIQATRYIGEVVSIDGVLVPLLPTHFYSIKSFERHELLDGDRLARSESARWKEKQVLLVLGRYLGENARHIGSRIVHEAIMNSLRHPNATVIQTTARFDKQAVRGQGQVGQLTICCWDDGESMVGTLKDAIREGKPLRSQGVPEKLFADHSLIVEDELGKKSPVRMISSSITPDETTPEEDVLVSTIFPGITRDIRGEGHQVDEDLRASDIHLSEPGMGLYALTNSAVDVFGGTMSIRTHNYFLNVKPSKPGVRSKTYPSWRIKVRRFGRWLPPFCGNLLTVRLPIRATAP